MPERRQLRFKSSFCKAERIDENRKVKDGESRMDCKKTLEPYRLRIRVVLRELSTVYAVDAGMDGC